jgi:hypothetical protein
MAKKKSIGKPAAPSKKAGAADKKQPSAPAWLKGGGTPPAKTGAPSPKAKSKNLEMAPYARALLENARKRSPLDAAGVKNLSKGQVDAIRQLAVALAENDLTDDEDPVLICNRATEPAAIPITELLYDTCRWCEADIYYDRMMPSPPNMIRVCVPCGIMLLDAEKKGRN